MAKNQSIAVFARISTCTIAVGATLALFLSACGGDSGSNGPGDNVTSESDIMADTFDDLPVCSDKREGVTAYVKDKKTAYVCVDGDWDIDGDELSSSVKDDTISSSSNGKTTSSSSAKDQGSSSSSTDNAKSYSSVKNKSSSSLCEDCKDETLSSSSLINEQHSSTSEQSDIVAIKDKSISGVLQKGPFVMGSVVKLYELDGKTYAQTGKSFSGKIFTEEGFYNISKVTLASPYALLETSGYFRNEISGNKSKGAITLNALTDLSNREKVNINLLTNLEYLRVLYLVGSGFDLLSAKKLAEAEILNAFGIKYEFVSSEDLDIFGKGDANAALLAFSVLMLGGLEDETQETDVAELTERLTMFALDIEKDGYWDDGATKTNIADWAQTKDLSGELARIRSNIEKWNLGRVPEFEKYVRNFWYTNYGLGECGANNKAEVLAVKNERCSKYGTQTRYICKDGAWTEATDLEKDTYKWDVGEDGEIRIGDVTQTKKYDYDAKIKAWRDATTVEVALGGCTEAREADFDLNTGKVNDIWYICKNREWVSTNNITVDTLGWNKGNDGDLRKGNSTDAIYKYDEVEKKWLTATHKDSTLKLMGCTTKRNGEIGKSSSNNTYYVCENMDWQLAQVIDYDTYGKKCSSEEVGRSISGEVISGNKYYCSANGWISLFGWNWEVPKEVRLNSDIAYGTMTDPRDNKVYKIVKIEKQVWMAENLNYADSLDTPSLKDKSWCYDNKTENCAVTGRLYTWAATIDSIALYDGGNGMNCGYGEKCVQPDIVRGICPPGWHLPTYTEWETLIHIANLSENKLMSQTAWRYGPTDDFGFSALPAGLRWITGVFTDCGHKTYFWSATASKEQSVAPAYAAGVLPLENYSTTVSLSRISKEVGVSVRCIQD